MNKLLLTTAAALALAACNGKSAEQTASDTTNATGSAISNAGESTGSALSNAAGNTEGALANAGDSKPVNAVQDTAAAAVGLGSATLTNDAKSFVPAAAISDMYEIEAGKIAKEKAKSPAVKKFAEQMITDHTATSSKLKATLKEAKLDIAPPTALDDRRKGMIENLKSAKPEDFDKVYLDQQTAAHREAVTLMKSFADDGDNDALKKLAAATTPKIQQHFDMVRQLDKSGADNTK